VLTSSRLSSCTKLAQACAWTLIYHCAIPLLPCHGLTAMLYPWASPPPPKMKFLDETMNSLTTYHACMDLLLLHKHNSYSMIISYSQEFIQSTHCIVLYLILLMLLLWISVQCRRRDGTRSWHGVNFVVLVHTGLPSMLSSPVRGKTSEYNYVLAVGPEDGFDRTMQLPINC
jgi:hypothetical protein